MRTERAEALIRQALTEGRVQPFIRSKVRKHIEAPMTQMLLGEPQVKQMAAQLARHGFTHESSMAFNSKVAHHKFKRGHRLITVTRFKEPEGNRVIWSSAGLTGHGQDGRGEHYTTLTTHLRAITPRRVHEENSRFKIEPAPFSIPPDFADHHNRAWISPEGKVHALRQGTEAEPWRGDTHGGWAMDNRHVHGEERGDLWTVFDNMQSNGWVRKTAKDFYDIGPYNEDSLATVHKHFTTHHPELDSVRVYSSRGGGEVHRLYKGGINEETSRFITEPSLDDVPGDWSDHKNRAWISPEGKIHKLKNGTDSEPWGGQTHTMWAEENRHVHGFHGVDAWSLVSTLQRHGWIRKTTKNCYDIGRRKYDDEGALAAVHQHFTTHHPELRSVNVLSMEGMHKLHKRLRDPESEKRATDLIHRALTQNESSEHSWKDEFGEKSDWAHLQHRAWISPEGEVHHLGRDGQETHGGWITRVRNSQNPYTEYDDMTKAGWVRKVNPRRYTGAKHAVKNVIAHLRQHHPEVERALFTAASGVPYTEYVVHPKSGSVTKRGLSHDNTPMSESAPPTSIQWNNPNWMFDRDHAWISPEGEVHKLDKGDHHAYWAMRRGGDFRSMLDRGWIRKADKAIYQVGDPMHFPRVFQHVDTVHPRVKRISITHPREPGALDTATVFNKRDGEWAPEASR